MKDFLELVKLRQSDRQYETREIETEKLERILQAAVLAPSACNAQPWKMIVVQDAEKRMQVADATSSKILGMNHFTKQAPIQIVVVEENPNFSSAVGSFIKNKPLTSFDIGILTSHITLAAAYEGLGTCILGWFDEKKVKKILSIPSGKRVSLIITLGYSAQPTRTKQRKEFDKVVSNNKY